MFWLWRNACSCLSKKSNLDKTASIVISKNVAEVWNDIAAVVARMLVPNRVPVEILIGKMVEKDGIATTGVEAVRSS